MIYTGKFTRSRIYVNTAKKTIKQVQAETGADIVINGGYFNMLTFKATGNLKADGVIISREWDAAQGYCWTDGLPVYGWCDMKTEANFIGCVTLIEGGKALALNYPSEVGGARGRTAFGMRADGTGVWFCSSDSSGAMTVEALQQTMLTAGCRTAIMLDSGGSSQLICPAGVQTTSRAIHHYWCFWLEDEKQEAAPEETAREKVYLSPSAQPANPYAAGNTNEQVQCNRIADYARSALERCGFEVKKAREGQDYKVNVKESNEWGADIHMPIHTNAGGGYGTVVFVGELSAELLALAEPVYNAVNSILLRPGARGVRKYELYEVVNSKAPCVYVECEFHDNPELAAWIIDNAESIGEAIARGLCEARGRKYIAPGAAPITLEDRVAALEAWARGLGYKGGV